MIQELSDCISDSFAPENAMSSQHLVEIVTKLPSEGCRLRGGLRNLRCLAEDLLSKGLISLVYMGVYIYICDIYICDIYIYNYGGSSTSNQNISLKKVHLNKTWGLQRAGHRLLSGFAGFWHLGKGNRRLSGKNAEVVPAHCEERVNSASKSVYICFSIYIYIII